MFKFLKEKLQGAISKFSKKAKEEKQDTSNEISSTPNIDTKVRDSQSIEVADHIKNLADENEQEENTDSEDSKISHSDISQELDKIEEKKAVETELPSTEQPKDTLNVEKKENLEKQEPRKGFFSKFKEKLTTTKISYEKFESLFTDLQLVLMENNVAIEVIDKIKTDLANQIVEKPISRHKIEEKIKDSLKASIDELFSIEKIRLLKKIKGNLEKPFVIAFFGINGSGKTTSIAKVTDLLKKNNISCVLSASDTFRAASIEQLQIHADKLGVKLIKHDYGSDPAAVAFDSIKHAKAKGIDVVLIDTAGRLHNQSNLMDELKKIVKVSKPDLKLFVGESIAGNDCIEQIQKFDEIIGIDGIILTKADVDEKGGTAVSVSYITKKPIVFIGVGQEYSDFKEFDQSIVVEGLGL
jgi:fused signal recognition particle receptor